MKKCIAVLGLILAPICGVASAQAAIIIDQQSLSTYYPNKSALWATTVNLPGGVLDTDQPVSSLGAVQTITAGKKGILDSILFAVMTPYPGTENLKLSIIDGDYISGSRATFGTITVPFSSLPASTPAHPAYSFDVSALNYHVSPGEIYSVLLQTETNTAFSGQALFGAGFIDYSFNPDGSIQASTIYSTNYQGGKLSQLIDGTPIPNQPDYDLMFASFVNTSSGVPEPATWALMIVGFGGIGAALRTNRHRRVKRVPVLTAA